MARLDFFLIAENILSNLKNCKVEPSYRSDHSMIILELEFNPFIRGKVCGSLITLCYAI
jgi:hypothetical protein